MTSEMQSTGTSAAAIRRKRRGRLIKTRRGAALATAFLFVATPAMASIIIQNFMSADITATPACFTKVAGDDVALSDLVTFDGTLTEAVEGADLIQEKITLEGQIGDRVIFTDVVTYTNGCDKPLSVVLRAPEAAGGFVDTSMQIWISDVAAPADVDPNTEALNVPAGADWNDVFISVPAGTADGPIVGAVAGPVTIPVGETRQGAFVVSSGTAATGTSTLTWIAEATVQ